ncbi:MAG TPA: DNA-formamidopyrimidine glycosylase [Candidatus Portnoybacteria bacterium]|nr:DNA-formamidopyrimidine glycosylase [Candidatus Portnoybacteria bacterium]
MPELPEVETIKRQLQQEIVGKRIIEVEIKLPKLVKLESEKFKKSVEGSKIENVWRRAKIIGIDLDNQRTILIHLKLTGQLIYFSSADELKLKPYSHLIYHLDDGSFLVHNDARQFGYVKLVSEDDVKNIKNEFGVEPLSDDFTLEKFKELIKKRPRSKIKTLLMDQKWVAGIGNAYSDEILFSAKVNPFRYAGSLTDDEIENIYQAIRKILTKAIEYRGTTTDTYVDTHDQAGNYVQFLKVYKHQGEICSRCGQGIITTAKIGGRTAHFCPVCQK